MRKRRQIPARYVADWRKAQSGSQDCEAKSSARFQPLRSRTAYTFAARLCFRPLAEIGLAGCSWRRLNRLQLVVGLSGSSSVRLRSFTLRSIFTRISDSIGPASRHTTCSTHPYSRWEKRFLMSESDWMQLPDDLPIPTDDGGCDHLVGLALPSLPLVATTGGS